MASRLPGTVVSFLLLAPAFGAAPALATPDDENMPGRITVIRGPGGVAKFVARSGTPEHPSAFGLPDPADDPTVSGGRLDVFDTASGAGSDSYALPAAGWHGIGNPPGSVGFKFKGGTGDACRVVLIKANVVKGACRGSSVMLSPPFAGAAGIVLTVGNTPKHYCATFGGSTIKNDPGLLKRKNALPDTCPTTTTTTLPPPTDCCGGERITLLSGPGTLQVDNLPPFGFPAGVQTTLDVGAAVAGLPECRHDVIVPAGGFVAPQFEFGNLNYCTAVTVLGCESGGADGRGTLWDAAGAAGLALTDLTKAADTSDGVCNPPGQPCATAAGGAGANTLGQVVTTRTASASTGVRTTFDLHVRVRTWSDNVCSPSYTIGCCSTATYDPMVDIDIFLFDFILSPTTDTATGLFTDMNGDGCLRAGAGFDSSPPGNNGPKSHTGSPAPGPCCTAGQSMRMVAVSPVFSGGPPLFDLGFWADIPSTVASCGVPASGSCVLTTDPCLGSPSEAFLDEESAR
jgi:hypothetical protein